MKNALNSVKVAAPATNAFDLSHDVKLSCDMGDLIPVLAMEVIPGDRVRLGCENLIRLAPMLAPMMHRVDVRVEYFFVPNRIIWENWETWISNGGSDAVQVDPLPAHPFFLYSDQIGSPVRYSALPLLDYMGLPDPAQCPEPDDDEKVSALPFGAYQKVWQDYYRDENLQALLFASPTGQSGFTLVDGDNSGIGDLWTLRKRCWEADYFTKALPFAQKGEPVELPIGNMGDVRVTLNDVGFPLPGTIQSVPANIPIATTTKVGTNTDGNLLAKLSEADFGSTAINDLRLAFRLQEWLEKNARGGTRYSELIRSHFNVFPEDARLQRPEYIVGIKNPIQISEVLQTSESDGTAQGTMAGHGVSYSKGNYGKYFCKEHGYIIGMLSIMPKTAYQQGIPRHFLKYTDPTELAWPTFGNLGEQPIQNREVMAFRTPDPVTGSLGTFGYTPRYMEYKNLPNRVAGDFKTSLDFWHMGRIFDPATPPALNGDFVQADPTQRVFAVETPGVDSLWCQLMHHITVVRALPFYGTPTF